MGIIAVVVHDYGCQIGSGVCVLAIKLVKGNGCENAISVVYLGLQLVQIFNMNRKEILFHFYFFYYFFILCQFVCVCYWT